ncbi:MAG: DNA repair protein RadA [Bacteroidaceae bacterium]|nr:DNA repair protein RadA [Bacteroidaceae bacterium]MBQ8675997.1 DNA repair protein RadA [Bacteroidaceae bacterium]MBQ9176251.1 DNA repair protein RadA [Bacteroidaceae bacterium]MBR1378492.1 DNA repair protein RadA [Bacteroidaceae bacterium]
MAKERIAYVCSSCGYDSPKWVGRCPSCGEWNTFVEQKLGKKSTVAGATAEYSLSSKSSPISMSQIPTSDEPRINLIDGELNRVLGGGLVPGSLTLLGGEPGIGKSTLILQTVLRLVGKTILYVSGEESARQLKLRADRILKGANDTISEPLSDCQVVCEVMIERVFEHIKAVQPDLVVIDSIQTMATEDVESSPGSVSQIRECAAMLLKFAKQTATPVIIIGHINKEGSIAGPKILEHMVDTVLQFEGDQHYMYRIVRAIKNRFGSTAELGIYEMYQSGLRQVSNPSELLLSDVKESEGLSGVAIASAIEGVRPLLIETQALVSTAAYGTPQRSATGFDLRRMNMLLAVLEKRVGFKIGQKDVYLNIAGGIRVTDPAIDLSVIASVLSSNVDTGIERDVCMAGEVGLSGEIRPVSRIVQRVSEAERLGFKRILIPASNIAGLDTKKFGIEVKGVRRVEEALRDLFG